MQIGVPKEVKNHEYRVGLTPAAVRQLTDSGHRVLVQRGAGSLVGFSDVAYREGGAQLVDTLEDVYVADLIVKVKELLPVEYSLVREGQTLLSFLHLAPDPERARQLIQSKVTAIAYETVTDRRGRLPLLEPMSEIAGRVAVQLGAHYLQMDQGGRGVLLGGVPGVLPGRVAILGGGVVGTEAVRMAMGLGARVFVLDRELARLRELDALYGPRLQTLHSTSSTIEEVVLQADLVIGAVLVPGKNAPKLISRSMVSKMLPGSVLIDVAIDQGGISETSRPTSHADPIYVIDGVIHYCVTNIPGICARTSTLALTNATLQYVMALANKGVVKALREDIHLLNGLNVHRGFVTHSGVAQDLGYAYVPPLEVLA